MNALKDYVEWKLTHSKGYMSRNLFDNTNLKVQERAFATNVTPTKTGVSYTIASNAPSNAYPRVDLVIGPASKYAGKTITMTVSNMFSRATKLSVRKLASSSSAQNGSELKQSGDLFYATITIEDKDYTTENLCIMLYCYMGSSYNHQAGDIITHNNIMVYEGSDILPYEPYGKHIK